MIYPVLKQRWELTKGVSFGRNGRVLELPLPGISILAIADGVVTQKDTSALNYEITAVNPESEVSETLTVTLSNVTPSAVLQVGDSIREGQPIATARANSYLNVYDNTARQDGSGYPNAVSVQALLSLNGARLIDKIPLQGSSSAAGAAFGAGMLVLGLSAALYIGLKGGRR